MQAMSVSMISEWMPSVKNAFSGSGLKVLEREDNDAKNAAAATPLLSGAGHAEIVRALLGRGANANAVSALKTTPLWRLSRIQNPMTPPAC